MQSAVFRYLYFLPAVKKGKDRLRVDTYWNTSSVPEKYRRREKAGLEKVKEILEAEENISGHDG